MLNSYDSKLRKPLPKTLMLKDYLRDDLSSCSSNGFRSFPRRQCCTTVRFLLEIDLKSTSDSNHRNGLLKSKSRSASTTAISAFQRASEVVINAVKLLSFAAAKSPLSSPKPRKTKSSFLPRSLSRKLLKRSFWKRTAKEIEPWKSFKYFLDEKEKPSVSSPSTATTTTTTVTTATHSNSSTRKSNSDGWSDSEFNSDYLQFSSGNSENSCANDVVEGKKDLSDNTVSKRVGVTAGEDSIEAATTPAANSKVGGSEDKWQGEEEKEQYSPVSVLNFPFHDDEEVSSPFQSKLSYAEGTKQKLMHKIRRFKSLADQLEPVDLDEKHFSSSEFTDESSLESPIQGNLFVDRGEEDDENETERKANDLLELLKATNIPLKSIKFKADNLLLDLFRERLKRGNKKVEYELLLNEARDWMNGQPRQMLLGWEVQKNRQEYVIDMEKGGRWKWDESDEYKEEVAMELEAGILASLVDELLLDLNFSFFQI